jgi:hypothetical protein
VLSVRRDLDADDLLKKAAEKKRRLLMARYTMTDNNAE